jgi:hypothetical protein
MTTLAPRSFNSAMIASLSKAFVSDQSAELDAVDQGGDAHSVEAMPRQELKANQIAERIGERQDFGGHAALGSAYGLARSPPFAPWPWRWTLTMVASTMANSISGSSDTASKSRLKTSAFTQSR